MKIKYLNIPIKLMQSFRGDKSLWKLFCFAVCMKLDGGNSCIKADVTTIRRFLQCNKAKAECLVEMAKQNKELFRYYPKQNLLVAKSFVRGHKDWWKKNYTKAGKEYDAYEAGCLKLVVANFYDPKQKVVSHFRLSSYLRDQLLLSLVNAVCPTDDFISGESPRPAGARMITLAKFAKALGMSSSAASRRLHKLAGRQQVAIKASHLVFVYDEEHGIVYTANEHLLDDARELFDCRKHIVAKAPNLYGKGSGFDSRFVNVIFNHPMRRKPNKSKKELLLAPYN